MRRMTAALTGAVIAGFVALPAVANACPIAPILAIPPSDYPFGFSGFSLDVSTSAGAGGTPQAKDQFEGTCNGSQTSADTAGSGANASATASWDLGAGSFGLTVHASGALPIGAAANAAITYQDLVAVKLNNPAIGPTTVTPFQIDLFADGKVSGTGQWAFSSSIVPVVGTGTSANFGTPTEILGHGGLIGSLVFSMTGTFIEFLFTVNMDANAANAGTVDFGDTFALDLILPPDATYQTASGYLFTGTPTAVPEPSALALAILPITMLGATLWRRERRQASVAHAVVDLVRG
jgi:hypothetical protein